MISDNSIITTADRMKNLGCHFIVYEESAKLQHPKWIEMLSKIQDGDTIVLHTLLDAFISPFALRVFFERCINRGVRLILLKESLDTGESTFCKQLSTIATIFSVLRHAYYINKEIREKGNPSHTKLTLSRRKKELRDEKIINMYSGEYSIPVIMEECKVTRGTLYNTLKKHGISSNRTRNIGKLS